MQLWVPARPPTRSGFSELEWHVLKKNLPNLEQHREHVELPGFTTWISDALLNLLWNGRLDVINRQSTRCCRLLTKGRMREGHNVQRSTADYTEDERLRLLYWTRFTKTVHFTWNLVKDILSNECFRDVCTLKGCRLFLRVWKLWWRSSAELVQITRHDILCIISSSFSLTSLRRDACVLVWYRSRLTHWIWCVIFPYIPMCFVLAMSIDHVCNVKETRHDSRLFSPRNRLSFM